MSRKEIERGELVTDLDAILSRSVTFKLHEKIFSINPVSVEQYFSFANSLSVLKKVDLSHPEKLIDYYHELFIQIVPEITREDIGNCSQQQIAGLYNLISRALLGEIFEEAEKKTLPTPKAL